MSGVVFPKTAKGDRSTTDFNKQVYGAMASALGASSLATAIAQEKDWRHKYGGHLDCLTEQLVVAGCQDKSKCVASLRAGLASVRRLEFEGADSTEAVPFEQAMLSSAPAFEVATIKGAGQASSELVLPYKGSELKGAALEAQCDAWVETGTMEPDCAVAIKEGAKNVGSVCGRTFIILGAGSELGPLRLLLLAGATVVAIATRKPSRWAELIKFARGTAGTLILPVSLGTAQSDDQQIADAAGLDLIKDAPAAVEFSLRCAKEAQGLVTVGTYLYVDGEANVRLTAVSDYIVERIATDLGPSRASFAWLASCSTTTVIPEAAAAAQKGNLANASWWQKACGTVQTCDPLADAEGARIFKGFEVMQGPNYALAQLMRQWRAMTLAEDGFKVSTPITPMCRTESVTSNATMATILDGVGHTRPMEAFSADAARAAMCAVLVSELAAEPAALATPLHLMTRNSFHSGMWRCPFSLSSLGTATWVLGKVAAKR